MSKAYLRLLPASGSFAIISPIKELAPTPTAAIIMSPQASTNRPPQTTFQKGVFHEPPFTSYPTLAYQHLTQLRHCGCSALCLPVCGRTRTARPEACEIGPLLVLHRQFADHPVGRERDTHGPISNSDRRSGGATTILQPNTKDSGDRSDANFGSKQPSNDLQPAYVSSATSASHVYRHQSVWRPTVHGR